MTVLDPLPDGTTTGPVDVDQLVLSHLPLARSLAGRYRNRGESLEDLVQVANLGLVKAARRFRPETGACFAAYARPTITGEIRRHFRDHGWDVRPPRRLQELRALVRTAEGDDQTASSDELIAERIGATAAEVREARAAAAAYSAISLDSRVGQEDDVCLADLLAAEEDAMATVDDLLTLARATADLGERDRRILTMRFYEEATQSQIAAALGISQMQVSRLLTALLRRLRARLQDQVQDQVPVRAVSAERLRRAGEPVPAWSRMPSSSSASTSWAA